MKLLVAAAMVAAVANVAAAELVVPIRVNGPPDNRIGIAILGDGYTQSELLKYSTDVDLLVKALFEQPPYANYASYFNVYRVDVVSNESGADHPERGVTRDTALGARYSCQDIQYLICVDSTAVNAVVSRSMPANARDIIIVLVNDSEYGGSGGAFTVASTNRAVGDLVLHEGGHNFGLLADEYETTPPPCFNAIEPPEANAAREIGREQIKWSRWIESGTPLPTTGSSNGVVGAFEGARYCTSGLYRPTFNSKMRSLSRPFEQVNSEQLIRRIYNLVSPIDAVSPVESALTPQSGASLDFSVDTPQPSTHNLSAKWFVDAGLVGEGRALSLNTALLSAGTHRVDVEVSDPSGAVRSDPNGVLIARRSWTLTVVQMSLEDLKRAFEELLRRWRGPR